MQKRPKNDFEKELLRYTAKLAHDGLLATIQAKMPIKPYSCDPVTPFCDTLSEQNGHFKKQNDQQNLRGPL